MVYQIKIKVRHSCPFLELTSQFDGISYGYCIRDYDVLSVPGKLTEKTLQLAKISFPNYDDWRVTNIQDTISYIQMSCLCESMYDISITDIIQRAGGLIKYPISYQNNWEIYSVMAFTEQVSANVMRNLNEIDDDSIEIDIISNIDLGIDGLFKSQMISGPELFASLTPRQLEILIEAIEMGYYEIPRNIRTKDIATRQGKRRYTIEKLLRNAENKIMKSLTPYLYFKQYLDQKD